MLSFAQFLTEAPNVGAALKRVMASAAMLAILDSDPQAKGTTWSAGGCGILAYALKRVLPQSLLVDVVNSKTGKTEHVAVSYNQLIHDADGAQSPAQFLDTFAAREGLPRETLSLKSHDMSRAKQSEIALTPLTINKLATALNGKLLAR